MAVPSVLNRFSPRLLRRWQTNVALWGGGLLLVHGLTLWPAFSALELAVGDLWPQLAGARDPARHVALVVVDETTLAAYKEDPLAFWTPKMGEASARLHALGARVVGLDMVFSLSPEQWLQRTGGAQATYDAGFRQEIAQGRLIQVAADGLRPLLPAADYLLAVPALDVAGHVGWADLQPDADGVVRRFNMAHAPRPGLPQWTFAALLARRAGGELTAAQAAMHLPYLGPPGHFPRVSLANLLAPEALSRPEIQALHGRVVIIGAEYAGMNDVHATPYSGGFFGRGRGDMSGVEVHANIVEALLRERAVRPLPLWGAWTGLAVLMGVAVWGFQLLRLRWAGLLWLGVSGGILAAAYGLFLIDRVIPAMAWLGGLAGVFLAVIGLRYALEERERARISGLFGRYVSPQVVAALIESGEPPRLGGVRSEVTVLFSDIRDFTVLSERLQPEEVVELLNRYFSEVCAAVQAEGGTLDKFIGDAVMAQFGAPLSYADHADRAVRTALRIAGIARGFDAWVRQRFPDRDLPRFAVGVGLHSGAVVAGNVGSAQRLEYTVIGDVVNVAARIESACKAWPAAVLASAETLRACRGRIRTGDVRALALKGKSAPVTVCEVLGTEEAMS